MSLTTQTAPEAVTAATTAVQPDVSRPSHDEVIALIMRDGCCDRKTALRLMGMIGRAVKQCRKAAAPPRGRRRATDPMYIVPQADLEIVHGPMCLVMPDRVADPKPGTAHAAINRYHTTDPEISVVHTGDTIGSTWYCGVMIAVQRAE